MNLTFPLPRAMNPSASVSISFSSELPLFASAFVRRFAISTCLVEMVMPVTAHPWTEARWRVVPPMPQPTSRMLLPGPTLDISRRSRMRLSWAVSLVSVDLDSSVGQ